MTLPWPVFFQALRKQKPSILHAWLRYWIFSDDGAALIPRPGDRTAESLAFQERQDAAALFAAVWGGQSRTRTVERR
jgi:hypothetical protein